MLALFAATLIGGYAFASSWAVRRGRSALLMAASAALLTLVGGATFLGLWYSVPSTLRLIVYVLGFMGPIIVVPTVLLWHRAKDAPPSASLLALALVGAGLGFAIGYVIVVFGIGVW